MTKLNFDEKYQVDSVVKEKAFTSTSLSFEAAKKFGLPKNPGEQTEILIIKIKSGAGVSPITFDFGQGEPGRVTEFEALLPPDQSFRVKHRVHDEKNKISFAFLEQI